MEAQNIMAESLNNLVEFTITVPLSSKTKNIHTNTFIYLEWEDLPDNITYLYKKVKNKISAFRYTLYREGYWYVKSMDINFKDGTMQLGLSPFPTPYSVEKLKSPTQKENVNQKSVKTTAKTSKVDFLSKSDMAWAKKTVEKATRGKTTDLQKAKAIYTYFKKHYGYTSYSNLRYTTPTGNREKAFQKGSGNCADGANILETLFLTAGLNARIKHAPNHYIIKLKIDGKTYWVDNSRGKGVVTWDKVWRGVTSNSEANITDGRYING